MNQKSQETSPKHKLLRPTKGKQDDKLKAFQELNQKKVKNLRLSCVEIARSEAGKELLSYLFDLCGYDKPVAVMNAHTSEIILGSTQYNEGRRSVWMDMRKVIPEQVLYKLEIEKE